MNIEWNAIYTSNLKNLISEEKHNTLIADAEMENSYIIRHGLNSTVKNNITRMAREVAYTKSKYSSFSNVEKALLAANIAYNDYRMCYILKAGNFSVKGLTNYLKVLTYLKRKMATIGLTDDDTPYQRYAESFTRTLANHFRTYTGSADITLIINKISDILTYRSDLLEAKDKKGTRKNGSK